MDAGSAMAALAGGLLIGASASGLLWLNGRVAGISNILAGLLRPESGETGWRGAFLAGLLTGGIVLRLAAPDAFGESPVPSLLWLVPGGLLVGFGTGLSNGCTSGHGVCGLSRRSPRSLAATLVFMATGAATVFVVRHLLPGGWG